MVRPTYVDSNGVKKGAWSEEEDNKLRAYIKRYGHWNWRLLPKYAGLARCGKSCRLRWVNYLKPGTKHGKFSKHEEDLVAQLHDQLGNKWSAIAANLPGRTDNEIKNFWHTNIKKRGRRNPEKNIETDKVIIKDDDQMVVNGQPNSDQITIPFDKMESTSMDSIKEFNIVNSGPMITSNDGQACDRSSSDSNVIAYEQSSLDDMMSLWTQPFLDHDTASYSQNTCNFPDFFQSQQLCYTELSSFEYSSFPSPDILDDWKSSYDGNTGSSQPFVLDTCQENTNYDFSSQEQEEMQGENYDYCFQYYDDHGLDLFYHVPQEY